MLRFESYGVDAHRVFATKEDAMQGARMLVDTVIASFKEKNIRSIQFDQIQAESNPIFAWELMRNQIDAETPKLSILPVAVGDIDNDDDFFSKFMAMLK
jgi:hypothetical protein